MAQLCALLWRVMLEYQSKAGKKDVKKGELVPLWADFLHDVGAAAMRYGGV